MKLKTLGLSLGATTSIVAPITTLVACDQGNKVKPTNTVPAGTQPGGQQSTQTTPTTIQLTDKEKQMLQDAKPYTVDSLRDEAKEIGWNGQFWKGGMLQESFNQIINFAINLAMKYGYNPYENQDTNDDNNNFAYVINDENATTKSTDDIFNEITTNQKYDKTYGTVEDGIKDLITAFKAVKPNPGPVTEKQRNWSNMFNGDRTFKDSSDAKRTNLEENELTQKLYWDREIGKSSEMVSFNSSARRNGFMTLQFYDNRNNDGTFTNAITGFGAGHHVTITRIVKSPDLLVKYPKIDSKIFHDKYGIFMADSINKLLNSLGSFLSRLANFYASPILINALSYINSKVTIGGELPIDFYDKLDELNQEQSINWLAIKAMYTGYEAGKNSSWKRSKLERAVSGNWDSVPEPVPAQGTLPDRPATPTGIRDRNTLELSYMLINSGDTAWFRKISYYYLFDPSKTVDENDAANPEPESSNPNLY